MAEAGAGRRSQRYYDLDALRAVAMFLGIVLHTSVFLLPEMLPLWPIHDPAATGDPTYKLVIETIHGFRMPVFFLLSGFFSALLWQRRSLRTLLTQRLRRVGIPLAVGCFTVVPLSVWILAYVSGFREPYDFPLLDAALAMALRPGPSLVSLVLAAAGRRFRAGGPAGPAIPASCRLVAGHPDFNGPFPVDG